PVGAVVSIWRDAPAGWRVKVVLSSLSGGLSLGGRETRLVECQGELRVGGSDFPAHVQMLAVQLAGIQDRQEAEPRTTGARDVRPSVLCEILGGSRNE